MLKIFNKETFKSVHKFRSLGLTKFKLDKVQVVFEIPKELWDQYKHNFEESNKKE
ncbi:MAG: hypothetical protein ACFFG0_00395 [Candidatus Thorarchaeota archaeon]